MPTEKERAYSVKPFSKFRKTVIKDTIRAARHTDSIHILAEMDVTEVTALINKQKAESGKSLSFTAFIVNCLAQAVDEDKDMHACRYRSKRLVMYDEVDVLTMIEREVDGELRPLFYVVRAANNKSFTEIQDEIRDAKDEVSTHRFYKMPGFIRRIFWRGYRKMPQIRKLSTGTVGVSNIGMAGDCAGFPIPLSSQTLFLSIGSTTRKPGVVGNEIKIRNILHITISADHYIIDGAPLMRFATRLRNLIESGFGLLA